MMKRFIALLLILSVLAVSGCAGKKEETTVPSDISSSSSSPVSSGEVPESPDIPVSSDIPDSSDIPENSDIPESSDIPVSSETEEEKKPLEVVSLEYAVRKEFDDFYLFYAAKVHNPNDMYSVMMPVFSLTMKDKEGKVSEISSGPLCDIAAQDTQVFAGACIITAEDIEELSFSFREDMGHDYVLQNDSGVPYAEDLNVTDEEKTGDIKYEARVTNLSPVSFSSLKVMVIYRKDGKLVSVDTRTIDGLEPGDTESFYIESWFKGFEYDEAEILVRPV